MQKKTHLLFGLFLASILFYFGVPLQYTILIGFISFVPDIDWLADKIWFKEDSLFKRIWYRIFKSKSIHRTFLHNIWFMILIMIVFGHFSGWNLLTLFGVFVGFSSHLLMDSLTVSGVYWLWPYGDEKVFSNKKFYRNGKFITGSLIEKTFQVIFTIGGGIFFGLGFMKISKFKGGLAETVIIVLVLIFVGYILMQRFSKALSVFISRTFQGT